MVCCVRVVVVVVLLLRGIGARHGSSEDQGGHDGQDRALRGLHEARRACGEKAKNGRGRQPNNPTCAVSSVCSFSRVFETVGARSD